MPAPGPQLSAAELAALEHAFAADPSSDAFRPLTEAYLAMGRFMEAMVVCKKGVKAHPRDPSPRVLLARIYAAQGKDRKALEEVTESLKLQPDHVAGNRLAGVLQFKLGEKEAGVAALLEAWRAAPSDAETLDAMKKWGVAPSAPQAPPPPVQAPPPPTAQRSPVPPTRAASAQGAGRNAPPPRPGYGAAPPVEAPPVLQHVPSVPQRAVPPTAPSTPAAPPAVPETAFPTGEHDRAVAYAEELASRYSTQEYTLSGTGSRVLRQPKRHRAALVTTLSLAGALLVALSVWGIASSIKKSRAVEIDKLLRTSREYLERDSYASYKEAAKLCERIIEIDPDVFGGHAYLAYINAIRWGEHGESEALRDEAKKHLEAVTKKGHNHSHAYAARAYLRFYGGDARGAINELKKVMEGPEGGSALLHGVLGAIQMQAGDLDAARDDLSLARRIAPGDVRITQLMAEQWRRRGQGYEIQATALYDTALTRLAPDHVPSLLGKARLLYAGGYGEESLKRIAKVFGLGQAASPRQIAMAHALRGSVLYAQGKSAEGSASEQQALTLDASNPDIHHIIGRRKLRSGDGDGAVASIQKAIQLEPTRIGFYVDLAGVLMQRPGGTKQAVAALEKANERMANSRITKLLGDAYRADGDLERARATYEKAIAAETRYPEARIALALLYRERKDFPKALSELDRAVKDYSESATGQGTAYAEIAQTEEARGSPPAVVEEAYKKALKADTQNCQALFWLGRSRSDKRSRTFDRTLATQMLADYLKICPAGPSVAEAQRIVASLR